MKLVNLRIQLKQQTGLGFRIQIADCCPFAQLQSLTVDRRKLARDCGVFSALARGLELFEAQVNLAQPSGKPHRRIAFHKQDQPGNACVDRDLSVAKQILAPRGCSWCACCFRRHRPQVIARGRWSAQRGIRAAILRLLLAPSLTRNLLIAAPQHRVKPAHLHHNVGRRRGRAPLAGDVILEPRRSPFTRRVVEHFSVFDRRKRNHRINSQRMPGLQSVFQLLWKNLGVAGRIENLLRNLAGDLVLAVAVGNTANKSRNDQLRTLAAHRQNSIVQNAVMSPALERLLLSFGKSEVHFRAPELYYAVIRASLQQFIGADDPQRIVCVRRHGVLPALAAIQRQQRSPRAQPATQISQQRAVFIVRMRHNHHHAGRGSQPPQRLFQSRRAAIFGQGQSNFVWLGKRNCRISAFDPRRLLRLLLRRRVVRLCQHQPCKDRARHCSLNSLESNHISRQCTIRGAHQPHEFAQLQLRQHPPAPHRPALRRGFQHA